MRHERYLCAIIAFAAVSCTDDADRCAQGTALVMQGDYVHEGADIIRAHCGPNEATGICRRACIAWIDRAPNRAAVRDGDHFALITLACTMGAFPTNDRDISIAITNAAGLSRVLEGTTKDAALTAWLHIRSPYNDDIAAIPIDVIPSPSPVSPSRTPRVRVIDAPPQEAHHNHH